MTADQLQIEYKELVNSKNLIDIKMDELIRTMKLKEKDITEQIKKEMLRNELSCVGVEVSCENICTDEVYISVEDTDITTKYQNGGMIIEKCKNMALKDIDMLKTSIENVLRSEGLIK